MAAKVLVAGGTGFVGQRLVDALLARGDEVCVVTRKVAGRPEREHLRWAEWLPALDGFDAVVHLAGAGIFDGRWTAKRKAILRSSRLASTHRIVEALGTATPRPRAFVCASAIGIYGDCGERVLTEEAAPGDDYLATLCRDWEAEAARASEHGVRTTSVRIGVVLGLGGGALTKLLLPFKLGLGGPIGAGRQSMSWVHVDDLVRLLLHALDDERLSGPVNATAPGVVSNAEFSRALGRALHRPALLPLPPLALRLALGEVAEVLTGSQNCSAQKSQAAGFEYRFPALDAALADLLGRG